MTTTTTTSRQEDPHTRNSASASPRPEWLRLPAPGRRCPYTGLSRTTLNELILGNEKNERRPPVRSVMMKKRGALRGIRLIDYDSLMQFLNGLDAQERQTGGVSQS